MIHRSLTNVFTPNPPQLLLKVEEEAEAELILKEGLAKVEPQKALPQQLLRDLAKH